MYISDPARPFQVPTPVAGSRADILLQNSANINVDRSHGPGCPKLRRGTIELHFIWIVKIWFLSVVYGWIESDLYISFMLRGDRIEDYGVNFFEMFEKSMKVVELQVAAGIVTALYMKDET